MSGSADTRKGNCVKKRLSDGTFKEYTYTTKVSKQFKLSFDSEAQKLMFEGKLENFKSLYGMKSIMDVFDFLLNDRNGDVYQSESEQHKNLLGKASHAKFICESTRLFKLVEDIFSHQRICDSVLVPKALDQNAHTSVINWQCENGHVVNWTSSDELGKNFL